MICHKRAGKDTKSWSAGSGRAPKLPPQKKKRQHGNAGAGRIEGGKEPYCVLNILNRLPGNQGATSPPLKPMSVSVANKLSSMMSGL